MKRTTITVMLSLISLISLSQKQDSINNFWRFSVQHELVSNSSGVGAQVYFPLGKGKINALGVSFSYLISGKDFFIEKNLVEVNPKNNIDYYNDLKNYTLKFSYQYRFGFFKDKIQIINSIGLFGEIMKFNDPSDFEPKHTLGNGGIVGGIHFRCSISKKFGIIIGKNFYIVDNHINGINPASRLNTWSIGVTF